LPNPLLCDPSVKADLEALNTASQLEYIDHVVSVLGASELRESHVLELQEIAVSEIYPCAGHYRTAIHDVHIQSSSHKIPEAALVPGLVREAIDRINSDRQSKSAIHRAAYTLWRFNWIHPFPGGNGRTARALTYLVTCMDHGAMLPGQPTMPRLIAETGRDKYIAGLREADAAEARGELQITTMKELLGDVLSSQLQSAFNRLASDPS
jgi:Fic family protein